MDAVFSVLAEASFFFAAFFGLIVEAEGARNGECKKAEGDGIVIVSIETWMEKDPAALEIVKACVVLCRPKCASTRYRTRPWRPGSDTEQLAALWNSLVGKMRTHRD